MTLETFLNYFNRLSSYSAVIPLIIGIFYIRTFNLVLKVLFCYLFFSFLFEIYTIYLIQLNQYNLFSYYLFSVVEFSIFTFIYMTLFRFKQKLSISIIFILIFILVAYIDYNHINGHEHMNELSRNVESIILIIFAILFFRHIILNPLKENLVTSYSFWFNTAIIVYFSGSFFIFLFSNYMLDKSPSTFLAIYAIHSFFNITFNILLAVALTKKTNDA